MKTLKEVANALNISESKAFRIKRKIELEEYPNTFPFMIWGTGTKKNYSLKTFKKYL